MLIVHVHIHVKPEAVDEFIAATQDNATQSRLEPGIARFDLLRDDATSERFVLVEIYRTDDAPARHKETAHYAAWRDRVAPMMAEPRTSTKLRPCSEEEAARWGYPA